MYFTLNCQALVSSLMYSPTQNIGLSFLLYGDDMLTVQLAIQILLIAGTIVARDRKERNSFSPPISKDW